ncbi:hypothetical protein [Lacticaseibacillus paracasei]|uniref:hypothetical protein n=1 Tax=Lacticaseibacillus paracasei TaxID=1597 RepID=UPI0011ED8F52|nr:hypothetical protein [Lacticaseibacillus paracasei]QEM96655.1 hypothetical protein D0638_01135 [Lacticaseibacillus paracasei]
MELDGKEIKENEQLTDAQLADLHKQYEALWDKLKKDNYRTEHQFMEVLYEEPDNSQNYEAAFFTYQIRKDTGDNQFDQLTITLNNKPTFHDQLDEFVFEISDYADMDALHKAIEEKAQPWIKAHKR